MFGISAVVQKRRLNHSNYFHGLLNVLCNTLPFRMSYLLKKFAANADWTFYTQGHK